MVLAEVPKEVREAGTCSLSTAITATAISTLMEQTRGTYTRIHSDDGTDASMLHTA